MTAFSIRYAVKVHRYFLANGIKKTVRRALFVCYWNTVVRGSEWLFDRRYGVQTGGLVYFSGNSGNPLHRFAVHYEATSPRLFRSILKSLGLLATSLTFFDMGCGKGRVLMLAAQHGFKRVVGVELDSDLYNIAARNTEHFQQRPDCKCPIEIALGNAAEYAFPDEDAVIFFFNPFKEPILREVLQRIRESAVRSRYRYIVYYNPVHELLFSDLGEFRVIMKKKKYVIYQMKLSGSE